MPLISGIMLAISAASAAKKAHDKKKAIDNARKKSDQTVRELRNQRTQTIGRQRGAYARALAHMTANRRNPNAWNFAASTYNQTQDRAAQNLDKLGIGITEARLNKPGDYSGWDMLGDVGMEVGQTGLFMALTGGLDIPGLGSSVGSAAKAGAAEAGKSAITNVPSYATEYSSAALDSPVGKIVSKQPYDPYAEWQFGDWR